MLLNVQVRTGNRLTMGEKPEGHNLMGSFKLGGSLQTDWRSENKVSPVTDQGFCGSCYAHTAVADI